MQHIKDDTPCLTLSLIPLAKDANAQGTIFGGWTLQQLDLAGSIPARRIAQCDSQLVVTKAINYVDFIAPIHIGDKINIYTHIKTVGNTSIIVELQVEAERYGDGRIILVAEAEFVYVKILSSSESTFPYMQ